MRKTTRLNIAIPEAYKEKLRQSAEERGVSMSQATRQAIALWIYASDEERTVRQAELEVEILKSARDRRKS